MKNKTMFVCELPKEEQENVRRMLECILDNTDDIECGMNSRVCDLEDTIDINNICL